MNFYHNRIKKWYIKFDQQVSLNMGQTQAQNQNQQVSSFCCLSRRYIVQRNMQKQNKRRGKNEKLNDLHHNQLQIYSKQRFREDNPSKHQHKIPLFNTENQGKNTFKTPQNQRIFKLQEVANLELESQLVSQDKLKQKNNQLNKQKIEFNNLPDIYEQIEKNSTRENSLSSKNLSNKNQISTNNLKLKNKIQNLKIKYCSTEDKKIVSTQNLNLNLNENKQKQLYSSKKHKKIQIQKQNQTQQYKNQQSEQIEFFSQDSESDQQQDTQNQKNQNDANEDMLNSKRIEMIIHQFKLKEVNQKKKIIKPALQRIPEQSQKIHSSKSEDEIQNHLQTYKNKRMNEKRQNQEEQKMIGNKQEKQKVYKQYKQNKKDIKAKQQGIRNRQQGQKKLNFKKSVKHKIKQQNNSINKKESRQIFSKQTKKIIVF